MKCLCGHDLRPWWSCLNQEWIFGHGRIQCGFKDPVRREDVQAWLVSLHPEADFTTQQPLPLEVTA